MAMSSDLACGAIAAIQEAEFRVLGCISVREQYKTKLRSLISALLPQPVALTPHSPTQPKVNAVDHASPSKAVAATTDASKKKQSRDALADRLRVRATMPAGKELQVVGDWLLLLRTASVNVVESIAHWRSVIHQGRPLPFEVDHVNYLLQMTHDVDFLDRCVDLVEWLDFQLVRNPFIVQGGLDTTDATPATRSEGTRRAKPAARMPPPPQALVKPLVYILPDDDVVDGTRIVTAQKIVTDEEALYGQPTTLRLIETYLAKTLQRSSLDEDGVDNEAQERARQGGPNNVTIFDEISMQTRVLHRGGQRLASLQRDEAHALYLQQRLELQITWTAWHGDHDLANNQRVWQYREQCRQATLRSLTVLLEQLSKRVETLQVAITRSQEIQCKRQSRLHQLTSQKDLARQQRLKQKRRDDLEEVERRRDLIRRKTVERNRAIKVKRDKKTRSVAAPVESAPVAGTAGVHDEHHEEDPTLMLEALTPTPEDRRVELDQKRVENLERRQRLRVERERTAKAESAERERRRDENARMFMEDKTSMVRELRLRRMARDRLHRERLQELTSSPIFSIIQKIGGVAGGGDNKFRVFVYDHRAKGYAPDGLRFVAYDPRTSQSFSLLVSNREYNALGYGRTQDGLTVYCRWLCLIYERRKRQFRLVWSGAPCPPPLRVREYDHALLCVHKEGVQVQVPSDRPGRSSFYLVAAYIRTSDCSTLRVVVSSVASGAEPLEIAVSAPRLLPEASLLIQPDPESGKSYLSWLHTLDDASEAEWHDSSPSTKTNNRVYSGDVALGGAGTLTQVHIFDVSATEYELHLVRPKLPESPSSGNSSEILVLLKHIVNPYAVRLPSSAFGDLLTCLRLERDPCQAFESSSNAIHLVVLPTWRACLARYVRAIRMAKFGCKICGVFHFVVVTIVQQKTEFRAHLLFELAPIGDTGSRQALRISLSNYLRCSDSIWRMKTDVSTSQDGAPLCETCVSNHARVIAPPAERDGEVVRPLECDWLEPCNSCEATQSRRLQLLHDLLETGELMSDTALDELYYATCPFCSAVPPPIVVVVPMTPHDAFDALLRHFFTCLDVYFHAITNVRAALEHSRICVVRVNTPASATQSNAHALADQMRRQLVSEFSDDTAFTMVLVYRRLDIFSLAEEPGANERYLDNTFEHSSSESALEQSLRHVAAAILHIGQANPATTIDLDHDSLFNFETYLVSEALLVEATQVLLNPHLEWRYPSETVGASSWGVACEYLQNLQELSLRLKKRQENLVAMTKVTRSVLEAYAAHPKWPTTMEEVRWPFQALLSTISHILYVQRLLDFCGGWVGTDNEPSASNSESVGIYELYKGVSVFRIQYHGTDSQKVREELHDIY